MGILRYARLYKFLITDLKKKKIQCIAAKATQKD